jgi:predicted double-glycine peptidase
MEIGTAISRGEGQEDKGMPDMAKEYFGNLIRQKTSPDGWL